MGTGPDDSIPDLSAVHVLVVTDHDDTRDLWERALQYYGALVLAASSARQALGMCTLYARTSS